MGIGNEVFEKRERKYEKIEHARIKISRQAVESLNFVVPISLQPNVVNLRYFKLRILLEEIILV